MCFMIPKFNFYILFNLLITKNVGIHFLPVRYLRPITALQVDEQSDTHADVLLYLPKRCVEGLISLHAHFGELLQHTRGINSAFVIDLQSNVVISDSQSTKHRVTLFHYVAHERRVIKRSCSFVRYEIKQKFWELLLNKRIIAKERLLRENIEPTMQSTNVIIRHFIQSAPKPHISSHFHTGRTSMEPNLSEMTSSSS